MLWAINLSESQGMRMMIREGRVSGGYDQLMKITRKFLNMSRELGRPGNRLVILGEGNTSAGVNDETFLVKASGTQLEHLNEDQVAHVRFDKILPMLDESLSDEVIEERLLAARVNEKGLKPSVETTFHGWLLRQEGVNFVGHTHPVEVNKILCSDAAPLFAENRLFPDEIVCCGPKSLLVDYVDPGSQLGAAIRAGWQEFTRDHGIAPKIILIRNHGMIAVGLRRNRCWCLPSWLPRRRRSSTVPGPRVRLCLCPRRRCSGSKIGWMNTTGRNN